MPGVFNNAAQNFNHIHFWPWMTKDGGGKKVPGAILALIDRDLGGFDKFRPISSTPARPSSARAGPG